MSPFYLVLYIFIALIVLLCVVSFAMYICHVCSGVCGENSDFEANMYMDEEQPLSNDIETNMNEDREPHGLNVHDFNLKFEEANTNHLLKSQRNSSHLSNVHISTNHVSTNYIGNPMSNLVSNHITSDTTTDLVSNLNSNVASEVVCRAKYNAPLIPPKPMVPVMIHSQSSSKKNSSSDPPPYGLFGTSNNTTPYRTSSCTPDSCESPSRNINVPKRKPPPPPPPPPPSLPPKVIMPDNEFLEQLPPPRDSMLPPPDLGVLCDSSIDNMLPPPPTETYLSDDSYHLETDNYLSDCD